MDIAVRPDEVFKGMKNLFIHADAAHIPFRDGVFDIVMSHEVMSHVRAPSRCLAEQRRVLKQRGRFIMSDGNLLSPLVLFDLLLLYPIRTRGQRGGLLWLKRLGRNTVYQNYLRGTAQKDEEIHSRFYWVELLERTGLTDIVLPFRISYVATTYICATKKVNASAASDPPKVRLVRSFPSVRLLH